MSLTWNIFFRVTKEEKKEIITTSVNSSGTLSALNKTLYTLTTTTESPELGFLDSLLARIDLQDEDRMTGKKYFLFSWIVPTIILKYFQIFTYLRASL